MQQILMERVASAPVFGSVINLINEKRIQAGKSPVGFINPALYANPQVMNDVTNGNNPGCGTEGFKAVSGWEYLPALEKLVVSGLSISLDGPAEVQWV